jgi:hypothetical protein
MAHQSEHRKNKLIIKRSDVLILGGTVKRKGGKLKWSVRGASDTAFNGVAFAKPGKPIRFGSTEVLVTHAFNIQKSARFVSRAIETNKLGETVVYIEMLDQQHKNMNRFDKYQSKIKREKIAHNISNLYEEESEEIKTFSRIAEKIASNK